MEELRSFEFDPRIEVYAFSSGEALEALSLALARIQETELTIAYAKQNMTMDRSLLKKRGIDREGSPAPLSQDVCPPFTRLPPRWMIERENQRRRRETGSRKGR